MRTRRTALSALIPLFCACSASATGKADSGVDSGECIGEPTNRSSELVGGTETHGGDGIMMLFDRAKASVISYLETYDPAKLDPKVREDVAAWLREHSRELGEDVQGSAIEWFEGSATEVCGKTRLSSKAKVWLNVASCKASHRSLQDAAGLLIHESVHHFQSIANEEFATAVASAVLQAAANPFSPAIGTWNEMSMDGIPCPLGTSWLWANSGRIFIQSQDHACMGYWDESSHKWIGLKGRPAELPSHNYKGGGTTDFDMYQWVEDDDTTNHFYHLDLVAGKTEELTNVGLPKEPRRGAFIFRIQSSIVILGGECQAEEGRLPCLRTRSILQDDGYLLNLENPTAWEKLSDTKAFGTQVFGEDKAFVSGDSVVFCNENGFGMDVWSLDSKVATRFVDPKYAHSQLPRMTCPSYGSVVRGAKVFSSLTSMFDIESQAWDYPVDRGTSEPLPGISYRTGELPQYSAFGSEVFVFDVKVTGSERGLRGISYDYSRKVWSNVSVEGLPENAKSGRWFSTNEHTYVFISDGKPGMFVFDPLVNH